MKQLMLIGLVCIVMLGNSQNIRYVKPVSSGLGNGTSWANASNDLQAMMNSLKTSGGQVWVAQGTYKPTHKVADTTLNGNLTTNRYRSFVLVKDVQVYGGFQGLATDTNLNQRNWYTYETILSGDIGIPNDSTDNSYFVLLSAGDVGTACLDGFTITKGNANGSNTESYTFWLNGMVFNCLSGGGFVIQNSSPRLANLVITMNYASHSTGGGNTYLCYSFMENLIVTNNIGGYTGGLYFLHSPVKIVNLLVANNKATSTLNYYSSGGLTFEVSSIYSDPLISSATITNATIVNNTAKNGVGGIGWTNFELRNSIVWGNRVDSILFGISPNLYDDSGYAYPHCIDNKIRYTNCLIGDLNDSGIILKEDPLFVDTAHGNYRLSMLSPVINRGTNTVYHPNSLPDISVVHTDLDGNPRIDCIVDLGAYEYQGNRHIEKPIRNYIQYACYGDSTELLFRLIGDAPWKIVYTKDKGQTTDTIENITTNPYYMKVYTEDTTLYKLISMQDAYCDIDAQDSILVLMVPTPTFTNSFASDTICNNGKTKPIDFIGNYTMYEWEMTDNVIDSLPQGLQTGSFETYTLVNNTPNSLTTTIRFTPYFRQGLTECIGLADSFSITVLPEPILQTVLQNDTLCNGQQTTPIAFQGQATTGYQWQNTGIPITGIPIGVQNGDFGNYTIENTSTTTQQVQIKVTPLYLHCSGEPATFNILVYPQIKIQSVTCNKSIFCDDELLELTVEATGGNPSYQWYHNNNMLAGETNKRYIVPAVSRENKGSYYVEVISVCGTEKSHNIAVNVSSDKMLVEKWDDVILVDNSTNEYTGYQWYKDGQIITGATNQFYQEIGGLDGCYSVVMVLKDGTIEHSCERCVYKGKKTFAVYPNPTLGELRVESGEWRVENVEVFDVLGRKQETGSRRQEAECGRYELNISHLPAGIYFLKIQTETEIITKKIIKE